MLQHLTVVIDNWKTLQIRWVLKNPDTKIVNGQENPVVIAFQEIGQHLNCIDW